MSRIHLAATLLLFTVTLTAQAPPSITAFTIDNGAAQTASDQVTLRFTYTNPAAIGQPIAQYRVRYKPPTMATWLAFGQWLSGPPGTPQLAMTLARNGTTPIAGEHRYQLQLRDVRGQVSGTAEAVIRRAVASNVAPGSPAPAAPTLLQTYRVTGSEVAQLFRLARQKGFQFAALPANGNTTCTIDDQANQVLLLLHEKTQGVEFPKPVCRYRAFEGRMLSPNWHQRSVTLAPRFPDFHASSRWIFERPLKPSGSDPSFVLYATITAPRGPLFPFSLIWAAQASHEITEVVLSGPSGKTWRNAFEP